MEALDLYLAEVGQIDLLSPDEELRLARLARRGNAEARDRLIEGNLRLVVSVAKKFFRRVPLDQDDLVQFGNLGLIRAVDKFDPERGIRLSTYATPWIMQAIQRGIALTARAIRLPVHMHDLVVRAERVTQNAEHALSVAELAEAINTTETRALAAAQNRDLTLSLDWSAEESRIGDSRGRAFSDTIADPEANTAAPAEAAALRSDLLAAIADELDPRDARIVAFRWGLVDGEHHTLEEAGREFGITRERVRQREKIAFATLRERWPGLAGWL